MYTHRIILEAAMWCHVPQVILACVIIAVMTEEYGPPPVKQEVLPTPRPRSPPQIQQFDGSDTLGKKDI